MFLENSAQTLIVEADQPLDQQPRYQQKLDTVGQTIGKKPLNSEISVKEVGAAESQRKRERRRRSSMVSETAFRARAFDQGICIPQQHLNSRLRRDLVGTGFQDEYPLLVA